MRKEINLQKIDQASETEKRAALLPREREKKVAEVFLSIEIEERKTEKRFGGAIERLAQQGKIGE